MTQLPPQSVFFGVALLVALGAATWLSRRRGLDAATGFGVFSVLVVCAVSGARLMWVAAAPEAGLRVVLGQPELLWHPLRGGFASMGGWLGAGIAAWLATRTWSQSRRARAADAFSLAGLAGLAVARLGCLPNGCDFGRVISRGLSYPSDTHAFAHQVEQGLIATDAARSLPTFPLPIVLASATCLIVVAAVVLMPRVRPGDLAFGASAVYFGARFVAEWFRSPVTVENLVGPFNVNHLIAVLGLVGSVVGLVWWRRQRQQTSSDGECP